MSEDSNKDIHYMLGKVDGKMDGLLSQMNSIPTTIQAHTIADETNFKEIRAQIASDRQRTAKYIGGAIVIVTLLSYLVPAVINKVLS